MADVGASEPHDRRSCANHRKGNPLSDAIGVFVRDDADVSPAAGLPVHVHHRSSVWQHDLMPRIFLVRHADAAGHDADNPGLSAKGEVQATQLANALERLDVRAVWHGPRLRAEQTARTIEGVVGCERSQTSLLDDRTPYPADERWDEHPKARWVWFNQVPAHERDPGGTALSAAWATLSASAHPGTLVAVTHAFVVAWFVSRALEASQSSWTHLAVAHAAITEIELRVDGHHIVHRFNDRAHLSS